MHRQKILAALILHFRTSQTTYECLLALRHEGIHQAIVIDNSEDDGKSLEALLHLAQWIPEPFSIILHSDNRNLGFARGVNIGLTLAQQQGFHHVLLINSDAKLETGSVAAMWQMGLSTPLVYPQSRPDASAPAKPLLHHYHRCTGMNFSRPRPGAFPYASGCCLLLNIPMLGTTDLFDEDFYFYGEDVTLSARLMREGKGVAECKQACVIHPGSGSAKNGSFFYEYHINRGHLLTASKLADSSLQAAFYLAGRLLVLPLRASWRCLRHRSLLPWRALGHACADIATGRLTTHTPPP